ncbi:uncharacterized protein LOC128883618 isoform X2 [Hylaeus volcanicus]|uniref:uncharacterized protein LOC128883618 isoform X2 n=1 Tax=Hylaeus volcanicus TaxID=313075 RepID=UPI0023B7CE0F|nr:uncharacterized protein LOC128883618 isoform X2 [Hylaeus volcanicus]
MIKSKGYTFADIVSDELASIQPPTYANTRSFVKPWSNRQQGDSFSSIVDGGYSDSDTSGENDTVKSWQPCNFKKLNNKFSRLPLHSMHEGVQQIKKSLLGVRDTLDDQHRLNFRKTSNWNSKQNSLLGKEVSESLRQNVENACCRSRSVENHGFSQNLHLNYQKLLDENVFLNGEIEKLTREIESLQAKTEEHKSELLATMTEKHERRIQLIKEEFDFRLEEQKERFKNVEEQAIKEAEVYKEKVTNLEKQLQSLYKKNQEIKEGTINVDESEFKELQNEKNVLQEQASAALATVAQFSEKHNDLTKTIDSLSQLIKEKDDIIKSTKVNLEITLKKNKNLKTDLEAKKKEYESLSTKAYRYTEDLRHTELALHEAKKNNSQLQLKLDTKIAQFESEEKRCTSLMAETKSLKKKIKTLACEKNMLSVQTNQYCNVSENAWREVQSVKKESELLRQRLEQQDEIISQLKHMTVRSSRPSFFSNPSHIMNSHSSVCEFPQYHSNLPHCFENTISKNKEANEIVSLHEKPSSESEPVHCNMKQHFKINSKSDTHSDASVQEFDKRSTNDSPSPPISLPPHAIEWLKMTHKKKEQQASQIPHHSSSKLFQPSNPSENPNSLSGTFKQVMNLSKNNRRATVTLLERGCTKFPELQKTIERSPSLDSVSPSYEWSQSNKSNKIISNRILMPTRSSTSSYTEKNLNAGFSKSRSSSEMKKPSSMSSSTSEDLTECYTQLNESDNEFSNLDGESVTSCHTGSTCYDECTAPKVFKSHEKTNISNAVSKGYYEKCFCPNASLPSKSLKRNHSYDCYNTQYKNAKGTLLTHGGNKKSHPVVRLIKVQTSQGQCRYELQTSVN